MTTPLRILQKLGISCNGAIHVGANVGQEISEYQTYGIKQAIFIEPIDNVFQTLCERLKNIPGYLPVQAVCSEVDGKTYTFHVSTNNNGASSSILKPGTHVENYPHIKFGETLTLQSTRLDSLLKSLVTSGKIADSSVFDLLCMDVQGAELYVLKGCGEILNNIQALWLEVNQGGMYEGDTPFVDMISYLNIHGFDLYFAALGKRGAGDALFVRRKRAASANNLVLDPDVAAAFQSSEAVNQALRAMLQFTKQTTGLTTAGPHQEDQA